MGSLREAEKKAQAAFKEVASAFDHGLETGWYLLNRKDLTLPSFTLYVQEDIGIQKFIDKELPNGRRYKGQLTAVYVPQAVKAVDKVNVILYLHGDKVRIVHSDFTIRNYLDLPEMPLRQGLNTSGKPYVLVAPTLGADSDMEFGNLGKNIDDYLDHAMSRLQELGPPQFTPPKRPAIGDLIIAGHSGGFGAIRSILPNIKRYKENLKEIWGFDIMYGNTGDFVASANVTTFAYFNDTEKHSRALARMKKPNVFVMMGADFVMVKGKEQSRMVKHDNLMQRFWLDRCKRIGTNGTDPDDKKRMVSG